MLILKDLIEPDERPVTTHSSCGSRTPTRNEPEIVCASVLTKIVETTRREFPNV